jgi:hypothetical protein
MFSDVKKGDKVYALTKGWGKIIDVDLKNIYIVVSFEDGDTREFFVDGKYYEDDKFPSLFSAPLNMFLPLCFYGLYLLFFKTSDKLFPVK